MAERMSAEKYTDNAIARARDDALEWLTNAIDGYPRSWAQEIYNDSERGYTLYDEYDYCAPPIAGYEALELEGIVTRMETVIRSGQERIHFKLITNVEQQS